MDASLDAWFIDGRKLVEAALEEWLPTRPDDDAVREAMRYSLLAGGKRLRAMLAILTGDALDVPRDLSVPYACALEMVHTYSLIHDDLPAMDNDALRRGRPTCHIVYGEATAMLAGDALLTRAFEILGEAYGELPAPRLAQVVTAFAGALGVRGMVGGQSRDMAAEGKQISLQELQLIHAGKTGALIRVSLEGVGYLAGAPDADMENLRAYGEGLGLIFQIRDDLLDIEGSADELGKTPGKDVASHKATYPRLLGLDAARDFLNESRDRVEALAEHLPGDRARFRELARWAASRNG